MSDPSRPANAELTSQQRTLAVAPDSIFHPSQECLDNRKFLNALPNLTSYLADLRMTPVHNVEIPPKLSSVEHVQKSTGKPVAKTAGGPGVTKRRSEMAKKTVNAGFMFLPAGTHLYASRDDVAKRMEQTVRFENVGTVMTLKRLKTYCPKKSLDTSKVVVADKTKARHVLRRCGLELPDVPRETYQAKYLDGSVPGQGVKVSKGSYNGLPVEGYSSDPHALAMCVALAEKISVKLSQILSDEGEDGVTSWINENKVKRPYLFTLVGRAKDDCYKTEKYDSLSLRWYTTWPRQIQLIIQQATQVLLEKKKSILDDTEADPQHAMSGVSLAHGNAAKLVAKLDEQLLRGDSHACLADDSWVNHQFEYRSDSYIVRLSLDCSSFDLTQLGVLSGPYHDELKQELFKIRVISALLWHNLMRSRDVVVDKTLAMHLEDMGTTGGALQTEVNTMIMEEACEEFHVRFQSFVDTLNEIEAEPRMRVLPDGTRVPDQHPLHSEEDFCDNAAAIFLGIARERGLVAKVDDCFCSKAKTVKEQLSHLPFLFVGMYFHLDKDERVTPFCDISRTMSQMVYPKGPTLKDNDLFLIIESVRLAGTIASMGVPPLELIRTFEAMRMFVATQLMESLRMLDRRHEGVDFDFSQKYSQWIEDNPLGPQLPASVEGILNLVLFGTEDIWMNPPDKTVLLDAGVESIEKDEELGFSSAETGTVETEDDVGDVVTYKPKIPDSLLNVQASDARVERPPSRRTHGRPPPITTEAEVKARQEARQEDFKRLSRESGGVQSGRTSRGRGRAVAQQDYSDDEDLGPNVEVKHDGHRSPSRDSFDDELESVQSGQTITSAEARGEMQIGRRAARRHR